eukprot:TRINITY_DN29172_c0_g1_i1.p1 TRINITY_DN29172_c0_g1~~TRINITY_DN29172_c0_g1_i1.p1  ORF type:complete len:821 (+),score=84.47 TRINITY_DN29172_c0_g1_i1:26-2464(+)
MAEDGPWFWIRLHAPCNKVAITAYPAALAAAAGVPAANIAVRPLDDACQSLAFQIVRLPDPYSATARVVSMLQDSTHPLTVQLKVVGSGWEDELLGLRNGSDGTLAFNMAASPPATPANLRTSVASPASSVPPASVVRADKPPNSALYSKPELKERSSDPLPPNSNNASQPRTTLDHFEPRASGPSTVSQLQPVTTQRTTPPRRYYEQQSTSDFETKPPTVPTSTVPAGGQAQLYDSELQRLYDRIAKLQSQMDTLFRTKTDSPHKQLSPKWVSPTKLTNSFQAENVRPFVSRLDEKYQLAQVPSFSQEATPKSAMTTEVIESRPLLSDTAQSGTAQSHRPASTNARPADTVDKPSHFERTHAEKPPIPELGALKEVTSPARSPAQEETLPLSARLLRELREVSDSIDVKNPDTNDPLKPQPGLRTAGATQTTPRSVSWARPASPRAVHELEEEAAPGSHRSNGSNASFTRAIPGQATREYVPVPEKHREASHEVEREATGSAQRHSFVPGRASFAPAGRRSPSPAPPPPPPLASLGNQQWQGANRARAPSPAQFAATRERDIVPRPASPDSSDEETIPGNKKRHPISSQPHRQPDDVPRGQWSEDEDFPKAPEMPVRHPQHTASPRHYAMPVIPEEVAPKVSWNSAVERKKRATSPQPPSPREWQRAPDVSPLEGIKWQQQPQRKELTDRGNFEDPSAGTAFFRRSRAPSPTPPPPVSPRPSAVGPPPTALAAEDPYLHSLRSPSPVQWRTRSPQPVAAIAAQRSPRQQQQPRRRSGFSGGLAATYSSPPPAYQDVAMSAYSTDDDDEYAI